MLDSKSLRSCAMFNLLQVSRLHCLMSHLNQCWRNLILVQGCLCSLQPLVIELTCLTVVETNLNLIKFDFKIDKGIY